MALAALIGAYETSEDGGLRALIPLAGRPVADLQVRMLSAVGAAPIVLLGDEPPAALAALVDQLRAEGLPVVLANGAEEAAARFEADHDLILLADGIVPQMADVAALAEHPGACVLTVEDDEAHEAFERIDLAHRWAGLASMRGEDVGATAAMLGDWDLPSTLLRRAIQSGALLAPSSGEGGGSLLVDSAADAERYSQSLLGASKAARVDWVARWVTAPLEDWMTMRLSAMRARPRLIALATPLLIAIASAAFVWDQMFLGAVLLFLSVPFDLVGRRVASLRLKPILPGAAGEQATWPLFLFALFALSLATAKAGAGWGALALGLALVVAAHFGRVARDLAGPSKWDVATFRRRPASLLLLPFALGGWWLAGIAALTGYALVSALWSAHGPKG